MSARTAGYLEAIEHLPEGAILVVPGVITMNLTDQNGQITCYKLGHFISNPIGAVEFSTG